MTYEPTSTITRNTAGRRVATAFFDNRDAAERARQDLVAAGFAPDAIAVAGGDTATSRDDAPILPEQGGFWHALKEFFMPDEDRFTYSEGLKRGGFVLSVTTDEMDYDRALDILDADGAVDIDERERNWLAEGWTGWNSGVDPLLGVMPDVSTAGFGASVAGEDGYQRPQPRTAQAGSLTTSGDAEAESRADPTRVGSTGAPGTMNPDMRERIGSGTASMTSPTPTGPQDATLFDNAAAADRKAEIEDASLGSPTRTGVETPSETSTVGSTNQDLPIDWESRRDTDVRRARVRGFILDPSSK